MTERGFGHSFFRFCASVAERWPWPTLAVALALTALAGLASTRLTIDSSTEGIIAEDVPFRENARNYEQVFPERGKPIVAMIEATGDDERALAAELVTALRQRGDAIERVERPGAQSYFDQNALLFLETGQLRDLRRRLESAGPLLSALLADPTLRGISSLAAGLHQMTAAGREIPDDASAIIDAMAETTAARAHGRDATLSWATALGLEAAGRNGLDGIVLVYPHLQHDTLDPAAAALGAVRSSFAEIAEGRDARLRLTGEPALQEQELDAAFSGAIYASILSFVLVALTLVLGIRSWRVIFALMATLVIGSVWTSGLAAVTVKELNLISLAFMVLFFGLGVDFGTHLALRQMEQVAGGADNRLAVENAVTGEGPAIALSVVCASIAFLSFVPTSYRGLAELGIISALGMLVAFVITVVLLPAFLTLLPPKQVQPRGDGRLIAGMIQRHPGLIVAAAGLVTVIAGVLATQVRIDVNPLNLQDPDTEAVQAYRDLASSPQLTPYALNVAAPSLDAARELSARLRGVAGVRDVRTIDDLVPANQDEKRELLRGLAAALPRTAPEPQGELSEMALQSAFEQLRSNVAQIAQAGGGKQGDGAVFDRFVTALASFAESRGTEPASLRELDGALTAGLPEVAGQLRHAAQAGGRTITIDDLPDELRRQWLAPDGQARVRIIPEADIADTASFSGFADRVTAVAPGATGVPVIVTGAAEVVGRSFIEAIAITGAAIVVILGIIRRRVFDVVLIMAPLVLAAIWTIAGAVLLDMPFNFANVIVIPLLLGLGVASSIHIVARAREAIKDPGNDAGVLQTSTPRAVLLTDANTAVAFVTLAVSAHRGLSSMGTLLGLAIMLSLIASIIVLPAVLTLLERRRSAQ